MLGSNSEIIKQVTSSWSIFIELSLAVLSNFLKIASVVRKAGMQADDGQFLNSYFP
jgi:hypothetical protein